MMSTGTRPPSFSLSWNALLSLPMRICNPPPAASRVRSCEVTPLVKVTLDDVLNRRHLPPLTLKDFEEWLVFVEGSPQYLYFILWLKEYESRYAAWLARSGCALPEASPVNSTTTLGDDVDPTTPPTPRHRDLSYINLIPSSAPLALFFTRAKQTFLDPNSNSPYSLGHAALVALSPSTHSLAPSIPQFTIPKEYGGSGYTVGSLPPSLATQPHPHPKELAPLAIYARKILKECLERFALTSCQNVGTRRAWCGIAGGTFITLVVGILPALAAFFFASSRWWRTVGWFGCWLGGTIVISSFHGICMMIYVFGDLRQLRSFELARPSISSPRAIARARPRLKSFFTREREEETDTGDLVTRKETGTQKELAPAQLSAPATARSSNTPAALQVTNGKRRVEKHKGKRPWSAGSGSQTSTGTPVVQFGAGTFTFGVGTCTTESDTSATTEKDEIIVGETDWGGGQLNEDDFGIEISPAYYYSGHGHAGETKSERRESVRSAGSGNRIGLVMQWVLGKRESVGIGTRAGTEERMKVKSAVSEKQTRLQSSARSYSGTFGIRSWRGGLGRLPEDGRDVEGLALEQCINITQTAEDEQPLDEPEVFDEDARLELEDMLTAEFISHDYPEVELTQAVVPCANPEPFNLFIVHSEKENTLVGKKRESSPVKFDFDKLPTASASRRMSSPSTFASSNFLCPIPDGALTTPEPMLLHPPPALYAHPGARIRTPTPALSITIPSSRPLTTAPKDRQWWDTCPRHPAVEATLASEAPTSTLASQVQILPQASPFLAPTRPVLMLSPASANPSTRPTSLASSDVHSRMRVSVRPVPAATSMHKSAIGAGVGFNSSRSSETWQTRFRRVIAVPAFGPLTRVLEPVVSRGQWEIVMRSACAAVLGAWVVIGCLVALPEVR